MIRVVVLVVLLALLPVAAPIAAGDGGEEIVLERFREYLRLASVHPTPDYAATTRLLLAQASSIGLQSRVLEYVEGKPLLLFTWTGRDPHLPSVLLNSHTDVVPAEQPKWVHSPFAAHMDDAGNIFARGSQDMKCVGMQYLEALRVLKASGFQPLRSLHVSFVPDEEIGGHDGMEKFVASPLFVELNLGIVLDEGLASPASHYRVFNAERSPWWFIIKATGSPGHGSKLFDNSAMENLMISLESIRRYRKAQFDLVKAGLAAEGEVVSVNPVYLKAGTSTPTGFVMNLQPSEAEAGFDMRVSPFTDPSGLEDRLRTEWAPASRNMTYQFKQKEPLSSKHGLPLITKADESNPWWMLLQEAISEAGGELGKPEIFPAATDCRYIRAQGIPAFGFSPMANTPILLHDHNEFLNKEEYLKGIQVYVHIIKSFLSFDNNEHEAVDVNSRAEL
ncbi:hypothetical protein GOP47_0021497 [Adiantum capillus-veneris]|uniref:N-acyl-aliphatic-L-amino acid amidohydrolase n=1 Tax=Adiantum capillus-veneris TaxID=13818 RepID=A0A9D4Z6K8_ADICA|nr:hypothetical protein GOP47_0021497 [Adiantum capillus-veneris]